MMLDEDVNDFLEHHGVKGQRWGVRKKEVSGSKVVGGEINLNTLKNYVKYGPFITTPIPIILIHNLSKPIQSGEVHSLSERGKRYLQKVDPSSSYWKKDYKLADPNLTEDQILSKVVKQVNPNYGSIGTKDNCRRCALAYEMRRRGNDVQATRSTTSRGQDVTGMYNAMTPGTKKFVNPGDVGQYTRIAIESINKRIHPESPTPFTDFSKKFNDIGLEHLDPEYIFKSIGENHPNGSRGEITMWWKFGGGHSMSWEMVNGRPVLFDAQSGKMFKDRKSFNEEYGSGIEQVGVTRLDNVSLNDEFLLRWLKNVEYSR